jgi:hypothetical protein
VEFILFKGYSVDGLGESGHLISRDIAMIPHSHHHKHKRAQADQPHATELWRGLHKDWRTWAVIGVMLAAIFTYVLTLDESVQPGSAAPNGVPAAVAPASPGK